MRVVKFAVTNLFAYDPVVPATFFNFILNWECGGGGVIASSEISMVTIYGEPDDTTRFRISIV